MIKPVFFRLRIVKVVFTTCPELHPPVRIRERIPKVNVFVFPVLLQTDAFPFRCRKMKSMEARYIEPAILYISLFYYGIKRLDWQVCCLRTSAIWLYGYC